MKIRRTKSQEPATQGEAPETAAAPEQDDAVPAGPRAHGPWDSAEVTIDEDDPTRIDLGGLLITGRPGMELRMQVDEKTQKIAAVLLIGKEGAVELRPFAAPRNGDIWADVRKQIGAETARRGGTATEAEGPYGPELRIMMPVKTADGQAGTQPSRMLGIAGPRWMLRVTFLGKPAVEPDPDGELEQAMRDTVVVRGNEPMAPGEALPLVMPANARPVQAPAKPAETPSPPAQPPS